MNMDLGYALTILFPQAIPNIDYALRDDGIGAYVNEWNLSEPQPTLVQLQEAYLTYIKHENIQEMNTLCEQDILLGFTARNNHFYEYKMFDQINMDGKVVLLRINPSIEMIEWETKDVGMVNHTRDEFFEVYKDAHDNKWVKIQKYRDKKQEILSCISEDQVRTISW